MNNAEKYFELQKQNPEFIESYNQISEQIDIEWELERVKGHIQNFIHQAIYIPKHINKAIV